MESISKRIAGDVPISSAAEAADEIDQTDTVTVSGFGSVGYPKAIPIALAQSSRDLDLTLISGGSVGREIDTDLVEAGSISRRYPYQSRQAARKAVNANRMSFQDRHISGLCDEITIGNLGNIDIAVVEAVSVDENSFIPSTSIGATPTFVREADQLIIEVNENQPEALEKLHDVYKQDLPPKRDPIPLTHPADRIGNSRINFDPDKLSAVVRTERKDDPFTFKEPTDVFEAIGRNLRTFLEQEIHDNPVLAESVYLQFGVGSLGNVLMSALETMSFGEREVGYFGEVMQDGILSMLDSETISFASATSLALSEESQQLFFDNIDEYAERIVLRPVPISNAPELINRFGVVCINSALEVDLYGNVNSSHLNGSHVMNAIGGSGDFNRNSPVAITALPSTTTDGEISRIVPMVPHVDHTEHDVDIIVTEHGIADFRGLTPRERARELVENCAAPSFAAPLEEYLERAEKNGGHIPVDLEEAFQWHRQWSES